MQLDVWVPGVGGRVAHLFCAQGAGLLVLLRTLECSLRTLSSPILVVRSLLLGSWYRSCLPGKTEPGQHTVAPCV